VRSPALAEANLRFLIYLLRCSLRQTPNQSGVECKDETRSEDIFRTDPNYIGSKPRTVKQLCQNTPHKSAGGRELAGFPPLAG
jgi:hypothetical protein